MSGGYPGPPPPYKTLQCIWAVELWGIHSLQRVSPVSMTSSMEARTITEGTVPNHGSLFCLWSHVERPHGQVYLGQVYL